MTAQKSKHPRLPQSGLEAKRRAALVLEVLCGQRTPLDAAKALQLNVPRYYQLESKALGGLLDALEPQPLGRVRAPEAEAAALRKELRKVQRESARFQALARAAQRSLGLSPPVAAKAKTDARGRRRSPRKPVVRALKIVAALQSATTGEMEAGAAGTHPAEGSAVR